MKLSTRMALAMVALVLLTTTALGLLTYRNMVMLILPRALDRVETHARLTAMVLEASLREARADAIGFQAAIGVHNLMMGHLGNTPAAPSAAEVEWRTELGVRFAAELAGKPDYLQFQVIGIDDGGRELLRVDRSGLGGTIGTVPDSELQREGDQDYFQKTIALPANEIFVSGIDLNKEAGVIETPHDSDLSNRRPDHRPRRQAARNCGYHRRSAPGNPSHSRRRGWRHAGLCGE